MKALIFSLLIVFSFQVSASPSPSIIGLDDPLPWPWGTECPFPWKNIEGVWKLIDEQKKEYFEIYVTSTQENGTKTFRILQLGDNGDIVAEGRGVSPYGQKIIRAAMHRKVSQDKWVSYWVIIRTYIKKNEFTCRKDSTVTVLTFRPINVGQGDDSHYLIEKVK